MCGRYTDTKRDKQCLVRMGIEQAEIDFVPRYNLSPAQQASVVMADEHGPELRRARWGLIPFWAKDEKIGSSLINARGETVATKPAFRSSFKKRRCLVLADGFYEWQKVPGGKQPIYIRMREGRPFVFAGLWDRWNEMETFTITTTEPNELCSKVHDRMPVILKEQDFSKWIDPSAPSEVVGSLIQSYAANEMESYPVSSVVNSPRTDSESLIQPIQVAPAPIQPKAQQALTLQQQSLL
jgi:putative SOS response-associated peptidase YedK